MRPTFIVARRRNLIDRHQRNLNSLEEMTSGFVCVSLSLPQRLFGGRRRDPLRVHPVGHAQGQTGAAAALFVQRLDVQRLDVRRRCGIERGRRRQISVGTGRRRPSPRPTVAAAPRAAQERPALRQRSRFFFLFSAFVYLPTRFSRHVFNRSVPPRCV